MTRVENTRVDNVARGVTGGKCNGVWGKTSKVEEFSRIVYAKSITLGLIVCKVTFKRKLQTRKPCYRKGDRAMRRTCARPGQFRKSLAMPRATIAEIVNGFCCNGLYENAYKIRSS